MWCGKLGLWQIVPQLLRGLINLCTTHMYDNETVFFFCLSAKKYLPCRVPTGFYVVIVIYVCLYVCCMSAIYTCVLHCHGLRGLYAPISTNSVCTEVCELGRTCGTCFVARSLGGGQYHRDAVVFVVCFECGGIFAVFVVFPYGHTRLAACIRPSGFIRIMYTTVV